VRLTCSSTGSRLYWTVTSRSVISMC
jgi:hypothetical protein